MNDPIRLLVADDHPIVREGLRALIATEPHMQLVGEAADGVKAIEQINALKPDVILLDLQMPRKDGLAVINEVVQEDPAVRIVVLTSFAEDEKVFAAIKAGALGYLLKDSSPDELLQAIRDVDNGESHLHPTIARKVMRELSKPATANQKPTAEPLTGREVEILGLVAQALTNREIGERLSISERTVRHHVSNILDKLHLASRTQATLYALREGFSDLSPS
ncbi:MAG: response regulator transcription factor [Chloroflexi bacterium]|nr:response regulator transcription factor [Chloroflexota bacterium]OJV88212.1 MAG: DNA-binding response regulator [Chloroflexi bacterium 54-19]